MNKSKESRLLNWLHQYGAFIITIGEVISFSIIIYHVYEGVTGNSSKVYFWILGFLIIISLALNFSLYKKINQIKLDAVDLQDSFSRLEKEYQKSERYKVSFSHLNMAFGKIHKLLRESPKDIKEYIEVLSKFCTHLSKALSEITQSECSACIKMSNSDAGKNLDANSVKVFTLCRDIHSDGRNEGDQQIQHTIKHNTDFYSIYSNLNNEKGHFFYHPNLLTYKGYSNTSFLKYDGFTSWQPYGYHQDEASKDDWPLPYKTCIVAPICPGVGDPNRKPEQFFGFLCVDSPTNGVFDKAIDVKIVMGCAEGLFNVLKEIEDKFYKQPPHDTGNSPQSSK